MSTNHLKSALGPLEPLFEDPEVTEVMVDGPERVTIEKHGKIQNTDVRFHSEDEVMDVIRAVLQAAGVQMEEGKTIYEVRLTDNSRMLAILSPTAIHGHSIVFRKWGTHQITWEQLFEYKAVTVELRDLIQRAIGAHVSILVAGGTASGKTTFMNRVVELIPSEERVVSVEQSHELHFDHPRAVFLEAGGVSAVTMSDLLTAGSKMRPDWLVIGELNGVEALRAMQILGNGHSAITTMHATSPENALSRLEAMCLMSNPGLGLEDIRQMIVSALRLILYQEYLEPDGKRRVTQVTELRGLEEGRYILQPLMRYNDGAETLEPTGARPGWEK
jgi:pilus assembly protein CpaF